MNQISRLALLIAAVASLPAAKAGAQMKVSYGDAPAPVRAVAPLPMDQVEKLPEYKGDLGDFLGRNLEYPDSARENHVEGITTLEFTVAASGLLQDLRVQQSSGHALLDNEAMRIFGTMQKTPQWNPGFQNGRAVPVRYVLPITFKL